MNGAERHSLSHCQRLRKDPNFAMIAGTGGSDRRDFNKWARLVDAASPAGGVQTHRGIASSGHRIISTLTSCTTAQNIPWAAAGHAAATAADIALRLVRFLKTLRSCGCGCRPIGDLHEGCNERRGGRGNSPGY